MKKWPTTIVLLVFFQYEPAKALEGDPDPTFGGTGQVAIARPTSGGNFTRPTGDLAMLADGRFLWAAPLDDGSVWIGRSLADGTPDTFGDDGNGRVSVPGCGQYRNARLVANGDGGVVARAGNCWLHLDADGHVDPTFGGGGSPAANFQAVGLARDRAGRYVLAGNEGYTLVVHRYDGTGLPDEGFGQSGRVEVVVPSTNGIHELHALALRPDDRIVVGGLRGNFSGPNLIVAQLGEDGTPDLSWNGNGLVDIAPPPEYNYLYATALAADADGSLVVFGRGSNGNTTCCLALTRLDAGGEIEPSFGLRIFTLDQSPPLSNFAEKRDGVVLLPDHRILMGTLTFPDSLFNNRTQYTLARALADGSVDATFGHAGWMSYTIADPENAGQSGDYNQMHAIAYDRGSNSIVILGRTFFEESSNDDDYTTMVRVRFDLIFADAFE